MKTCTLTLNPEPNTWLQKWIPCCRKKTPPSEIIFSYAPLAERYKKDGLLGTILKANDFKTLAQATSQFFGDGKHHVKKIEIKNIPGLVSLVQIIQAFPKLEFIEIADCSIKEDERRPSDCSKNLQVRIYRPKNFGPHELIKLTANFNRIYND